MSGKIAQVRCGRGFEVPKSRRGAGSSSERPAGAAGMTKMLHQTAEARELLNVLSGHRSPGRALHAYPEEAP